jgi:VWFA-related protein
MAASVLVVVMLCSGAISQESSTEYTFRSKTELVLVNVTVRDKNGNLVRDLKREDFRVLEDNKPQQVISFDLENTDAVLSTAATEVALLRPAQPKSTGAASVLATRPLRDRRLIILFFDLSSMQPDEIDQATTAAQN